MCKNFTQTLLGTHEARQGCVAFHRLRCGFWHRLASGFQRHALSSRELGSHGLDKQGAGASIALPGHCCKACLGCLPRISSGRCPGVRGVHISLQLLLLCSLPSGVVRLHAAACARHGAVTVPCPAFVRSRQALCIRTRHRTSGVGASVVVRLTHCSPLSAPHPAMTEAAFFLSMCSLSTTGLPSGVYGTGQCAEIALPSGPSA